jgi:ketosteroid isomerase-like protein
MKRILFLIALVFVTALRAAESAVDLVLRVDQSRLKAMMAGDGAALARVFSDEVVFVHSDGRIESKQDYVKNLTAGDTAYTDAKTTNVQAREISPGVVVLVGEQQMRKKLGTEWSELHLRFMSVWRIENGAWRMVAWESMKPSGNSVVPGKR